MNRLALFALVCAAAVIGLAFQLPMSLVLRWAKADRAGFAADELDGAIWHGRALDARLGARRLGDIAFVFHPAGLLRGRVEFGYRATGGAVEGAGVVAFSPGGLAFSARNGRLALNELNLPRLREGDVSVEDLRLDFVRGQCRSASGTVSTDALAKNAKAWNIAVPVLRGSFACVAGGAEAAMRGANSIVDVTALLRIEGDGRARVTTKIRSADPALGVGLALQGFAPSPEGYVRVDEGRWFDGSNKH